MASAKISAACLALALAAFASPAAAEGLGAEANYGRADGHWGAELGAGYALGIAGFSLTPGGGVYLRDGDTRLYGRVEAAYTIPLSATIGAGLRVSADEARPYATLAMPLLPKIRVKANVGPHYYAAGLTLGY
ncbi:hypothetical protein [Sphingobium ummariense]|uniref:Outer membrane protein beta-barrel domain-containing protein n=1 Tax=Sphingobium ummariense RL-3 TaxID=1346791 RepID=T0K511_9SPHN|nr:hypothetical protein [Sphingobium ummariense]EQB31749.1 hypothetical protein M529_13290 [Sphingobium ummariense RL-3]